VVGDRRAGGAAMALNAVAAAYERSAQAWRAGPEGIYNVLAEHLVKRCPVPLDGAVVLDVGAGSGSVTYGLQRSGARPIAVDIAASMLAAITSSSLPAAVADAVALPVASSSVDVVTAGFCLSHLDDPAPALREVARVLVPHGVLVASAFGESTSPLKDIVEAVAESFGYAAPPWHRQLKTAERSVADVAGWAAKARNAGFADSSVNVDVVDVGPLTTDAAIEWRRGMPHLAPFVDALSVSDRAAFFEQVRAKAGTGPHRFRPEVVILVARAR
jgi:ubiquinone/menaquinone biosynthesis C-methylase UbiE